MSDPDDKEKLTIEDLFSQVTGFRSGVRRNPSEPLPSLEQVIKEATQHLAGAVTPDQLQAMRELLATELRQHPEWKDEIEEIFEPPSSKRPIF